MQQFNDMFLLGITIHIKHTYDSQSSNLRWIYEIYISVTTITCKPNLF